MPSNHLSCLIYLIYSQTEWLLELTENLVP